MSRYTLNNFSLAHSFHRFFRLRLQQLKSEWADHRSEIAIAQHKECFQFNYLFMNRIDTLMEFLLPCELFIHYLGARCGAWFERYYRKRKYAISSMMTNSFVHHLRVSHHRSNLNDCVFLSSSVCRLFCFILPRIENSTDCDGILLTSNRYTLRQLSCEWTQPQNKICLRHSARLAKTRIKIEFKYTPE